MIRSVRRMRIPTVAFLLAFAVARGSAQTAPAAAPFPSDSAILAILQERVAEGRSTGIVVGLLEPSGATRIVAWGSPGPGQPPLSGESVFEIGSITKVFTGSILADMSLKGEVSLDDPVQKFLPAAASMPTRNGIAITLGMLSEQNSGLPRMPNNFEPADRSNPYADYGADRMYTFLSNYQLTRDPGDRFEYSNLGVGLLGHVLALRAGSSYEDVLRRRILEPLGMTQSGIVFTPWMREHLALGHNANGDVVGNWDADALQGAGMLRSTAVDMLKFLDASLHPERGSIHQAIAFAQKARADAAGMRIGLNWISRPAGPDTIVWHNGGTAGYRTFAGIIPSRRVGVVVLTNSGGQGADDIGFHLLSAELPLAPAASGFPVWLLLPLLVAAILVVRGVLLRRRQRVRGRESASATSLVVQG